MGSVTGALPKSMTAILADRPMSRAQIIAVALSVILNALDGFDVLAITFAAPGIVKEFGIGPADLGVAISSGLIGMAAGSLLLAPLGDRFGRRPLILLCIALMTIGMAATVTATGLLSLCFWRIFTGLGIGGMVAAINAVAAEFANERRRDLSVALMTIGYPVGGLLGGFAVAGLVEPFGWRSVFLFGAVATGIFLPIAYYWLPESLVFLGRQNTPEARAKIDQLMVRMGHPPIEGPLPPAPGAAKGGNLGELLGPRFRAITILLVLIYFLHILTFYFFSGWLPLLMSNLGHTTPDAIRTSAMMSMGGVIGGAALGWAAPRLGLIRLLSLSLIGTSVTFAIFGLAEGLFALQSIAFLAGICVFGGIVGLYSLLARSFPPELRVTGTGLAIGIGRGGAILGPIIGGILIEGGASVAGAIATVGAGALIAAALLMLLARHNAARY